MAYEELDLSSLAALFGGWGPKGVRSLVRSVAGKLWNVSRADGGWAMTHRVLGKAELESVEILVTRGPSGRLESQVSLCSGNVRSKRFKGLVSVLRSRTVTFSHGGETYVFRRHPDSDLCAVAREALPQGGDPVAWLTRLAGTPWVDVFDGLMAEFDRNQKRHLQNTSRINRFFTNKSAFMEELKALLPLTEGMTFAQNQAHQMTPNLQILDPTMRFTFLLGSQNILSGSDKHLVVDRELLNALRCAAIGCRRVASEYPGASLSVFLQDKAVWVTCAHADEAVLRRWSTSGDAIGDSFVELDDLSREMSIDPTTAYSARKGRSVFSGYNLCFRFQRVIAQVREKHRLVEPMLVTKGSPDPGALRAMLAAVEACERLRASYTGHRFVLLATGGRLVVEAKLDVDATWQDTTVGEQEGDESRLEPHGQE